MKRLARDGQDEILCDECRQVDFSRALVKVKEDKFKHVLVAEMIGLRPHCTLCKLFSETILPAVYKKLPSDTAWRLSAVGSSKLMSKQDSRYFSAIPRAYLYGGQGQQDAKRYFNSDRYMHNGLLALTKSTYLKSYAELSEDTWRPKSRLIDDSYDPEIVKHWIKQTDGNANGPSGSSSQTDERFQSHSLDTVLSLKRLDISGVRVIDCESLSIVSRRPQMKYIALIYVWRLANDDLVPLDPLTADYSKTMGIGRPLPSMVPRVVHNAM